MSDIDFKALREQLTPEDIKRILGYFNVLPKDEKSNYIIFPTCCHNLEGGSPKLYYYFDSHMFHCYTECNSSFDIFLLLKKMYALRNQKVSFAKILEVCGIKQSSFLSKTPQETTANDINYLYGLLHTKTPQIELQELDEDILGRFVFDMKALKIWKDEGISYNTMLKYKISFDPINNCIVIPNFDVENKLISIRGRYFEGEAKYKPIIFGDKVLSHPSAMNLYGLNVSKAAIERSKRVVVFEGEKSVMKMDTLYDDNNNSVATLGKNISNQQIQLLQRWGVKELILAYDADYRTYEEMCAKREEYKRIVQPLKSYFNVSIIMDMDMTMLGYKDSPIDKGQEVFEKLYKSRLFL